MPKSAARQTPERPVPGASDILFFALPSHESYADALVHPQHIGYRYLAAVLRKRGYAARIVNVYLEEDELGELFFAMDAAYVGRHLSALIIRKTLDAVRGLGFLPRIVGFSVTQRDAELILKIAAAIKSLYPHTVVLLGGVYASLCARELLSDYRQVDHILYGEAERSIVPYVRAITGGRHCDRVLGLAWRTSTGAVVINPPAPVATDLDRLPLPVADEIATIGARNNGKLRLSSSRGCHGRCSFCSIDAFNHLCGATTVRTRSPGRIVDEMEHWRAACGISCFVFVDPEFIGPGPRGRDRAVRFARELERRKLAIRFKIDCRSDAVEEATLTRLRRAGLYAVEMGVESFDEHILRVLNKKVSRQQNIAALRCLHALGLDVTVDYIFYTPWTTLDMMQEGLPLLKELGQDPHISLFPIFRPLKLVPHTQVLDRAAAECRVWGDYRSYQYRLRDPLAHDVFVRHMAFCERVRALILNSPRLRAVEAAPGTVAAGLVGEYHRMGWSLKMLTIRYLEDLLRGDQDVLTGHEKQLEAMRVRLRKVYAAGRLCLRPPPVASRAQTGGSSPRGRIARAAGPHGPRTHAGRGR